MSWKGQTEETKTFIRHLEHAKTREFLHLSLHFNKLFLNKTLLFNE